MSTKQTGVVSTTRRLALAAAALLAVGAAWWWWPASTAATAPAVAPAAAPGLFSGPAALAPAPSAGALDPVTRTLKLQELTQQLELVDHTLCSYQQGTKYPSTSRPIKEHPDQVYPNQPVGETNAMRQEGGGTDAMVQIQTTQSRVFMASGEAVAFSIKALDREGKTLPLFVTRSLARGVPAPGARPGAQVNLNFTDDGANGDAVAGDNVFSAVLAPAQSGFASFDGTIRSEIKYNVGDKAGVAYLDVIYTPQLPATWGGVRESIENGSLSFYLKAEVRKAGRYIVSGRVDDAKGRPFALVSFNDMLASGSQEVRLTVFGKLLRDQEAVMPLTLRDVDGYLLKEDTDPDRALMPRLQGPVHVSKPYPLKSFSDGEWQSEERQRYLTEYAKDVELAKDKIREFDPDLAQRQMPQSECSRQRAKAAN